MKYEIKIHLDFFLLHYPDDTAPYKFQQKF